MVDLYAHKRGRVAALLSRWNTGTVTLTRLTPGTPDPETPWIPGEPTTATYTLDARVDGVIAEYVDGTTILATDRMIIASPKARNESGAVVDIEPQTSDALEIDGAEVVVKQVKAVPASGPAAMFHIVIAS